LAIGESIVDKYIFHIRLLSALLLAC